jgi:hypothetical protein
VLSTWNSLPQRAYRLLSTPFALPEELLPGIVLVYGEIAVTSVERKLTTLSLTLSVSLFPIYGAKCCHVFPPALNPKHTCKEFRS